jgi:hypothetical protein
VLKSGRKMKKTGESFSPVFFFSKKAAYGCAVLQKGKASDGFSLLIKP